MHSLLLKKDIGIATTLRIYVAQKWKYKAKYNESILSG